MLASLATRHDRRLCWLHRNHPHTALLLFQVPASAAERAACANTDHDRVHLTCRVVPYLRACGFIVYLWICCIRKLRQAV